MDISYNKVDQTALPISQYRVSASEYNQIAGSLMHIITASGLTPDSADNAQLLTALGPRIVETYSNGTSWYRVWSDGWCEQGGYVATTANVTYSETFLKTFADTNYSMQLTQFGIMSNYNANPIVLTKNTSSFEFVGQDTGTFWEAKGYIA